MERLETSYKGGNHLQRLLEVTGQRLTAEAVGEAVTVVAAREYNGIPVEKLIDCCHVSKASE